MKEKDDQAKAAEVGGHEKGTAEEKLEEENGNEAPRRKKRRSQPRCRPGVNQRRAARLLKTSAASDKTAEGWSL